MRVLGLGFGVWPIQRAKGISGLERDTALTEERSALPAHTTPQTFVKSVEMTMVNVSDPNSSYGVAGGSSVLTITIMTREDADKPWAFPKTLVKLVPIS